MNTDDPTTVSALPEVDPKHLPREVTAFDSMTLRDWFAGQALCGLLSFTTGDPEGCGQLDPKTAAKEAYLYAEAMLARRNTPSA